jgi:beta-lactamase superfamily II metal-dependent hydrolase
MSRTAARAILLSLLCLSIPHAQTVPAPPAIAGQPFPRWSAGMLDIHQIVTGRGNSALTIFPDGTTLLFDAGDAGEQAYAEQRPDASKTPGQWIARYVQHMLEGGEVRLDYAVLTHFHPDHMGKIDGTEPMSTHGNYRLRGLTEVLDAVPTRRLVDRGWPDYAYLPPPDDAMFKNYKAFVAAQTAAGKLTMMGARAGSASEIVEVRKPNPADRFEARIISVNDRVWTGRGEETKARFPALDTIKVADDKPTENMCSITLRLRYGLFDYFTGGDMPGYPVPGAPAWHDTESDVAKVIGPTDVHVVNHHGSIEEENPTWLATLKSRVMIVPAWSATHPSPDVLKRMLSPRVYPDPRDIFITVYREATKATTGPRAAQVTSDHGHVVVRVEPGGARYWAIVLDDTTESYRVRSVHGPYASQ